MLALDSTESHILSPSCIVWVAFNHMYTSSFILQYVRKGVLLIMSFISLLKLISKSYSNLTNSVCSCKCLFPVTNTISVMGTHVHQDGIKPLRHYSALRNSNSIGDRREGDEVSGLHGDLHHSAPELVPRCEVSFLTVAGIQITGFCSCARFNTLFKVGRLVRGRLCTTSDMRNLFH